MKSRRENENNMKKFLLFLVKLVVTILILGGIGLFIMYKCTGAVVKSIDEVDKEVNNIDNYSTFIDDNVRYILTSAHPEFAYGYYQDNAELRSKTQRKIDDIANSISDKDQPSYKIALTRVSKEGNDYEKQYASKFLNIYNSLQIKKSPYKKDENKSSTYKFKEENSRVNFTVIIGFISLCSADSWDLDRYTEYLETGIFKSAPGESNAIQYTEEQVGTEEDNLSHSDSQNTAISSSIYNEITNFIKDLYDCKYSDKEIMSDNFYKDTYDVMDWTNIDDWKNFANSGYWKYPDGTLHKYKILKIIKYSENQYNVTLNISTSSQEEKMISLTILSTSTSFCVDDICVMLNEEVLEGCYSDYLTVAIAEMEADHEENY